MRGKLITLEGGEGSGKSTQARRLAEHLTGRGLAVLLTREPGGSPFAERVRSLILDPAIPPHEPLAEALLFYAARSDHLAATIRPALAAGQWVVCDRFSDSTRVYQGLVGGLPAATLSALEQIVVADTKPDLTLLLDLDAAVGLARARSRRQAGTIAAEEGADIYEARDAAFHERLRAGFLELARSEPARIAVIDAARDADAIAVDIRACLARRLGVV